MSVLKILDFEKRYDIDLNLVGAFVNEVLADRIENGRIVYRGSMICYKTIMERL